MSPERIVDLRDHLRLTEEGNWIHDGSLFTNRNVARLFHHSIQWSDEEKVYLLIIGNMAGRFSMEGTPYFVTSLLDDAAQWEIGLAGGERESLRSDTLWMGRNEGIYCLVQSGHPARFIRGAYQSLIGHALDEKSLEIGGQRIVLEVR